MLRPGGRTPDRDAAADLVVSILGAKRSAWNTADIRGQAEVLLAQTALVADPAVRVELAEDIAARIRGYAKEGIRGHLIQVLDPAEEDLPFTGRTEFEGIEEDLHLMVGRAERLRGAYRKRLDLHRDRIMEAARRIDFTFAVHRTDRAPHTALLALYGALSGEIDARRAPRPGG